MKLIALAALASTTALATPASAGIYANVESNGARVGSEMCIRDSGIIAALGAYITTGQIIPGIF